MWASVHKR